MEGGGKGRKGKRDKKGKKGGCTMTQRNGIQGQQDPGLQAGQILQTQQQATLPGMVDKGTDKETSWISAQDLTHTPEPHKMFHQ